MTMSPLSEAILNPNTVSRKLSGVLSRPNDHRTVRRCHEIIQMQGCGRFRALGTLFLGRSNVRAEPTPFALTKSGSLTSGSLISNRNRITPPAFGIAGDNASPILAILFVLPLRLAPLKIQQFARIIEFLYFSESSALELRRNSVPPFLLRIYRESLKTESRCIARN